MSNLIDFPKKLMLIFELLHEYYGNQNWWPSESQFETIVGAILTQNTAWRNAEYATNNLKASGLMSPEAIRKIDESSLAEIIRSSGYYKSKAVKLKAICEYIKLYDDRIEIWENMDPTKLRNELLEVYGIGPETADDIILYAANLPTFVIDTYTQRIITRVLPNLKLNKYAEFKSFFENHLPQNTELFSEYHALLDTHAKETCHKNNPNCIKCPLNRICQSGSNYHVRTPNA
jgi:endonuclease-3 related protein